VTSSSFGRSGGWLAVVAVALAIPPLLGWWGVEIPLLGSSCATLLLAPFMAMAGGIMAIAQLRRTRGRDVIAWAVVLIAIAGVIAGVWMVTFITSALAT
jgi:hypothetical protein